MKLIPFLLLAGASISCNAIETESSNPQSLFKLFKRLAGNWQCHGEFASGKKLSSDITMSLTNDGRALYYHHVDRLPNNYAVSGHWSYFKKLNELVVTLHSSADALMTYRVASWTDKTVTFEAKEYFAPPLWRENRFSYVLKEDGSLYFLWEVMSDKGWKMGDYLNCTS